MAQTKAPPRSAGTQKNTAKKRSGGTKAARAAAQEKRRREAQRRALARQTAFLCLFFAGVFLAVSVCLTVTGPVGLWLRNLCRGLFGPGAYLLPLAVLYNALLGIVTKPRSRKMASRVSAAYGLFFALSALVHLFKKAPPLAAGFMKTYWTTGLTLDSGGAVTGSLAAALTKLIGTWGAGIFFALVIVVTVMVITGLTAEKLVRLLTPKEREPLTEEELAAADDLPEKKTIAELVDEQKERRARGRRFPIDQPLDGNPAPKPVTAEEPPAEPARGGSTIPDFSSPVPPPEPMGAIRRPEPEKEPAAVPAALKEPAVLSAGKDPAPLGSSAHAASDAAPASAAPVSAAVPAEPARPEELPPDVNAPAAEAGEPPYIFPPVTLLTAGDASASTPASLAEENGKKSRKIVETLRSFGVETKVIGVSPGPTVTRYELTPAAGVKISKITGLADDIALSLAAPGVRIEAPIPGKAAVGIEVPNANISTVYIRDILVSREFRTAKSTLTFSLGKDIGGGTAVGDIAKMPHMLIAGATGSGKSVCINSLLISLLYKSTPHQVKLLLIDPKVVELGVYNGIPHLMSPVVTDPKKAAGSLNWAVLEMQKRYKLFADKNVRDIRGYNELCSIEDDLEPMTHIVIVIDELADLMMAAPGEVETSICRLAQMARAAGMHLVIATQRPSVDVITGTIKANIPSRIAFSVSSQVDSRTILDMSGAEKLLGRGDMLYYPVGAAKPQRIQGCFVSDKEVEAVVGFIKEQASVVTYDQQVIDAIEKEAAAMENTGKGGKRSRSDDGDAPESDEDEMLWQAVEVVIESGMASVSLLQRRLKLGYARAARIVDQMEERGIVGPFEGAKPRAVLMKREQFNEMRMRMSDDELTEGGLKE